MSNLESGYHPEPVSKKEGVKREMESMREEGYAKGVELRAKVLDVGSEAAVFEIAGHDNYVAKVDLKILKRNIKSQEENRKAWEGLDVNEQAAAKYEFATAWQSAMESEIDKAKTKHKKLEQAFPDYTLEERYYLEPVPVNREILKAATGKDVPPDYLKDGTVRVRTLVKTQERIPASVLESGTDICNDYQELNQLVDEEAYAKFNKDLIAGDGELAESYLRTLGRPENPDKMGQLLDKMKTDPELRAVMGDFAKRAVQYTNKNREILDLFGKNNVLAHKDEAGKQTLTFMDAQYPGENTWDKDVDCLRKLAKGAEITDKDTDKAINVLNYVRYVNALASVTGVRERLRLPVSLSNVDKQILEAIRARHGVGQYGAELPDLTTDEERFSAPATAGLRVETRKAQAPSARIIDNRPTGNA